MRIAIVGSSGQLGADVCGAFAAAGHQVVGLDHDSIEIANQASVSAAIQEAHPDIIVNTAAMHHVERCEEDPKRAFVINAVGTRNLATAAASKGAQLIHVSTDYVFDGTKATPYVETDLPNPLNVYGASKLAGEHLARASAEPTIIVRTSGLYGLHPCRAKGGLNFVELMLKIGGDRHEVKVVTDEVVGPTHTLDLARQLVMLAELGEPGIYHATSQGACSWFEFAQEIFRLAGIPATVVPASSADFPKKVARPTYSVLDNAALERVGLDAMPDWRAALAGYLGSRA